MEQSKFYQIKNVTEHEYTLVGCDGSVITLPIQEVDKTASVFTIQDAKDGDVLANSNISVFIYAEVLYNKPYAYCGVDKFGVFKDNCRKNDWTNSVDNVHPATKEQRDLLFQKMKDAGYEWDAEHKQINKIEQIKQKPAEWNRNDEVLLDETLHFIREFQQSDRCIDEGDMQNSVTCENWLKSLRPQSHWKPSDKQIEAVRIAAEIGTANDSWAMHVLEELYTELKKLKG